MITAQWTPMQLRHAALTDVGRVRDHNEDTFVVEAAERPEGALFLVCDGAGGLQAGELASDLASRRIVGDYYADQGRDRPLALQNAVTAANRDVYSEGKGRWGTTAVAAVVRNDAVLIANVGDSRALLVREGQPRQLTRDHSFVAEQVAAGVITAEQARVSSYRNIITRALGNRPDVEVDLFREPLVAGDRLVLCSDGLHGLVEDDEIALAVTKVNLEQAAQALIKLANDRGGADNITIVVIEVVALSFAVTPDDEPLPANAPTMRFSEAEVAAVTGAPVAPPAPPLPARDAATPSRRSIIGWVVMALTLIALVGALAYVVLTNSGSPAATPTTVPPPLTPITNTTSIPTRSATPTTPAAPTPTLVPTSAATTVVTP